MLQSVTTFHNEIVYSYLGFQSLFDVEVSFYKCKKNKLPKFEINWKKSVTHE